VRSDFCGKPISKRLFGNFKENSLCTAAESIYLFTCGGVSAVPTSSPVQHADLHHVGMSECASLTSRADSRIVLISRGLGGFAGRSVTKTE
jgi:hypothetical protein